MAGVSLWETLLKNCSKRTKINEGIILHIGNNNSGKFSLLEALGNINTNAGESSNSQSNSKNIIKSSPNLPTYLLLHEVNEDINLYNDTNKLHNWIINRNNLLTLDKNILNSVNSDINVGVVITLDLSLNPIDNIHYLKQWIQLVYEHIVVENQSKSEKYVENQIANEKYIDLAQKHRGNKSLFNSIVDGSVPINRQDSTPFSISYLGIPIVIVGTKVDLIDAHNTQLKEFYAYVRYVCLELGAAYMVTSTVDDVNILELKKYLFHRMFPNVISYSDSEVQGEQLHIKDNMTRTFIPVGLDSPELINMTVTHLEVDAGVDPDAEHAVIKCLHQKLQQGTTSLPTLQVLVGNVPKQPVEAGQLIESAPGAELSLNAHEEEDFEEEEVWVDALERKYLTYEVNTQKKIVSAGPGVAKPVRATRSKAVTVAASTGAPTVQLTDSSAAAASDTLPTAPAVSTRPRRATRASVAASKANDVAGGSGQDPSDFFKNLMAKK